MTVGILLSLLINIAVGIYFARFYPAHVKRQFRDRPVPPFFRAMAAVLPWVGYTVIVGSLLYALYLFTIA